MKEPWPYPASCLASIPPILRILLGLMRWVWRIGGLTLKQYWGRERAIGSGWLVPKEPIQWVY